MSDGLYLSKGIIAEGFITPNDIDKERSQETREKKKKKNNTCIFPINLPQHEHLIWHNTPSSFKPFSL